ncbi:MAG: hypothetical protein ABSB73_11590 [Solirubrobacteraceae bacterium]|jgi:hypothetical protein
MTETPTAKRSLRSIAPLAAAGCAALAAVIATGRRRSRSGRGAEQDPPAGQLAQDEMEALATGEGMPEAREA